MTLGKRHPSALKPGRLVVLMSMIALALVCFAGLAQAEECTSSSCVQYTDAIPRPEGDNTPTRQKKTPAKTSKTDGGNGSGQATQNEEGSHGEEGSEEDESSKEDAAVAGDDDKAQGSPGGGSNKEGNPPAQGIHQSPATAPASQTSDDDGSSPLVPILIAIAVLAGISVAAVMIRQRRQGGGSTPSVSPRAS